MVNTNSLYGTAQKKKHSHSGWPRTAGCVVEHVSQKLDESHDKS